MVDNNGISLYNILVNKNVDQRTQDSTKNSRFVKVKTVWDILTIILQLFTCFVNKVLHIFLQYTAEYPHEDNEANKQKYIIYK